MRCSIFNILLVIILFCSFPLSSTTKDSTLGGNLDQGSQDSLFVSLGSTCTTAHMHRECGIRKAAFPFDWIVSFDIDKLIDALEEDFLYFLEPSVLEISSGPSLLNHYYRLEFLNEGDWEDANYDVNAFIEKCQRRINRFRQLANYKSKVYFVRTSYPNSLSPTRVWKIEENIEITREDAEKLSQALRDFFPDLDFNLVIVNSSSDPGFSIEESTPSGVVMVKIDGSIESYKKFYAELQDP